MDRATQNDATQESYDAAAVSDPSTGLHHGYQTVLLGAKKEWTPKSAGRPPKSSTSYLVEEATGCWIWQRATNHRGYGMSWNGMRMTTAHRMMFERVKGTLPPGIQLDHLCRNRLCVNPEHLEPVTGTENTRRGLAAKLNPEQVGAIRGRAAIGEPRKMLAKEFGVSSVQIGRIVRGDRWSESKAVRA